MTSFTQGTVGLVHEERHSDHATNDRDETKITDAGHHHLVTAKTNNDVETDMLELPAVARAELAAIRQDIRGLTTVVEKALGRTTPQPAELMLPEPVARQKALAAAVQPPERQLEAEQLETTGQAIDTSKMPVGLRRDIARIKAAAQTVRRVHGLRELG